MIRYGHFVQSIKTPKIARSVQAAFVIVGNNVIDI